eukprot:Phypoly_transcript_09048.p1 GENE.Phypoly_transcript_09048~~Phypoly_transcript_09048.p1  ORF type:complete len:421 (+),score=93.76 Phypoly_transcript_09048:136-1263(+)
MATAEISATTTITFEQLTKYFHLPINDVAKELGICATMLKKICRKNGIPRWPHRKIKSLNKMIENLEASLQNNASEAEECILQEINILKNKKSLIMKNPSILVQGTSSNKRALTDQDGKAIKKIKATEGEDVPVATITIPKSSITPSSSSSLSINQLLTPSNPFSTPLTSYLLGNEEKDDKDSQRRTEEQIIVRPPSPSGQSFYKAPSPRQHYYFPAHANMPPEYHNNFRSSVEFLTQPPHHPSYTQQLPSQPQPPLNQESSPYVLPKLNFSPTPQQPSYTTQPSTPKFRPPSPITSSHQQVSPYAAPAPQEGYSPRHAPSHFFHHYHPQMPTSSFKPSYLPPQQQQPQPTSQPAPQQPVVLRWVMEYDKPHTKK